VELERLLRAGVPILLWGPPGVGKTASVKALAARLGSPIEVVLASIREPSDFLGLPVREPQGGVTYAPPSWAIRLAREGRGILFLDEISTAPPAVQAALLRVVLERVVGDVELPATVHIIAAGNPPEWGEHLFELSPPLANRFLHVEYRLDVQEWVSSFPGYWGDPPPVPGLDPATWAQARAMVAGFIRARPGLLLVPPRSSQDRGMAWPSPRSWDAASRVLAAYGLDAVEASEAIAGAVGEGPAMEFVTWVREQDLPDPEEVLARGFTPSGRGDKDFAILAAVAQAVLGSLTPERWLRGLEIMHQAAQGGAADVAALAVRDLMRAYRQGKVQGPLPTGLLHPFISLLKEAGLL